ncbi:hypothetical protein LTR24_006137 [Lithohypha guttulata]|uniref:Uncharacterized protein n=1 Tax=Lithohypha guttulata TaxID=1690604 RepID=A0ABR0K781_9EURO|nr:hypothetical protein LTR24_006137 [Lithohypha guttulata]
MGIDHSRMMFEEVNGELVPAYRMDLQSLTTQMELENDPETDIRMDPQHQRQFGETQDETEDEQFALEDIDPLPSPLRAPRLPRSNTLEVEPVAQSDTSSLTFKEEATPFVPPLEVPRSRVNNTRFNPIRPNIGADDAESGDEADDKRIKSVVSSSYKNTRPCATCRKMKRRCSHADRITRPAPSAPRSSAVSDPSKDSQDGLKSAGRIKKDGTPYERIPHDRSKGLSMTPSAVDYRERKIVQAQYQSRLAELLDADIVSQIEIEGGITPLGRLFKAGVRMMERVIEERSDRVKEETKHEDDAASPKSKLVINESELLRERATHAEEKLAAFKQAMRNIMLD